MSDARKYIEVLAFVAIWMAAGWLLHLDANQYLLFGVPLVALFQLFVRRQPLRTLWVRDAASFRLGRIGILLAAFFMIAPAYDLAAATLPKKLWVVSLWEACALTGAVAAAFALCHQRATTVRRALPSFVAAVLIGTTIVVAAVLARHQSPTLTASKLLLLGKQFLLYFAVSFVLEEVAFRGAFDSHVYQAPTGAGTRGSWWLSAIFISTLWGIWHLPILPFANAVTIVAAAPALIIVHNLVGLPLSFCWRKSGTLVLPAAAHALIDAIRNAMLS